MSRDLRNEKERAAAIMHAQLIDADILPTCINCGYWDATGETCTQYKMRPPAKIIVLSCGPTWFPNIPF